MGSNKLPLKYISKVDHERKTREYVQIHDVPIPEFNPENGYYTPLEVKAGDAVLFHGNFVHCSAENKSNRSRKALTFQFIETENTAYSDFNWIKKPNTRYLY